MDEEVAIFLAQRIAQLELDKASLQSDLNKERRLRSELEQRLTKLEETHGSDLPEGTVAPAEPSSDRA